MKPYEIVIIVFIAILIALILGYLIYNKLIGKSNSCAECTSVSCNKKNSKNQKTCDCSNCQYNCKAKDIEKNKEMEQ